MKDTVEAIFEKGVFRPVMPKNISIPEGQPVRLLVETIDPGKDVLALATKVYEGLAKKEIAEIEQIVLNRQDFFGDRKPL